MCLGGSITYVPPYPKFINLEIQKSILWEYPLYTLDRTEVPLQCSITTVTFSKYLKPKMVHTNVPTNTLGPLPIQIWPRLFKYMVGNSCYGREITLL